MLNIARNFYSQLLLKPRVDNLGGGGQNKRQTRGIDDCWKLSCNFFCNFPPVFINTGNVGKFDFIEFHGCKCLKNRKTFPRITNLLEQSNEAAGLNQPRFDVASRKTSEVVSMILILSYFMTVRISIVLAFTFTVEIFQTLFKELIPILRQF